MSWSPEECRGQGEPPSDRHALCARLVEKPDRGSAEHPESGPGAIVTRTASGPALAYWQAVLAGDVGSVSRILADSGTGLAPDSIFDTSDPERWRDFRFNIRALSTGQGHPGGLSGTGEAGDGALGSLAPASAHFLCCLAALRLPPGSEAHVPSLPRTLVSDIRRGADHAAARGREPGPHGSSAAAAEATGKA